ncbi:MAG: DDE transposase [Phycisphaerae bacterium]|nr:DDE transposase [Phycisphaerae bacterium]MBM90577.1 DDE transposase [Phycisphaerae bacterium]HCT43895.1 IS1595 family transposase [Phycisphaerales bacterium]|tara:strand:- start:184 stop:1143 length:960 start_codon:yes stop_codon:yes gene_type:complete
MVRHTKKPQLEQSKIIEELPAACASEEAAVEFLENKRWGECEYCPKCGCVDVYKMTKRGSDERNARYLWRCRDCNKQYTVRTGTIYEESLIPLHKWCRAYWEACACKNGVSALELSRKIQVSYKTALFMMHRIRWAMAEDFTKPPKMTGTVEADETYVGGKPRYKGKNKRGRGTKKQPVAAVVQRQGSVRTRVIPTVNSINVKAIVRDNVCPSSRVMTDQEASYKGLAPEFASHESINHGAREYVRGDVHTNTIEGFFSRVKRGLNGTYHAVSREHLHRYLAQFEFAYNTRGLTDGERVIALLKATEGKRLMYAEAVQE